MDTFADKILSFYKALKIKDKLPSGVEILNPYQDKKAFTLCQQFYKKYYNDANQRTAILGINPGRLGGGLTGIPFIDPIKLETSCGIQNDLLKKPELSADFVNLMIERFCGHQKFYARFYFNSVSPLGFTFEGKNLNYYDTPALQNSLEGFIKKSLYTQADFGINRDIAYCLGEGDNFKYLQKLNTKEKLFKQIIPLAHPRFIMQYKRKHVDTYVNDYIKKLSLSSTSA